MNSAVQPGLIAFLVLALLGSCSTGNTQTKHPAAADATGNAEKTVIVQNTTVIKDTCLYQGTKYSNGAINCQSGTQFRCRSGEWISEGLACGNSPIVAATPCEYDGIKYLSGSASCQGGSQFRCDNGVWKTLAMACPTGLAPVRVVPGDRTCLFGDATVASNSTICKNGSTFLCSDGDWINLGTECR